MFMISFKRHFGLFIVSLIFVNIFFGSLLAKEIIFQNGLNGYNGVSDTYLYYGDGVDQFNNYGASELLKVYGVPWDGNYKGSALIRFNDFVGLNTNQIPEDAVVTSARLELYKTETFNYMPDIKIYLCEMLTDWNAGSADGTPEEGSSCYQYRRYSQSSPENWGTTGESLLKDERPIRGEDYIHFPSVRDLPIGEDINVWISFESAKLTQLVNDWVSGKKENYGFILRTGSNKMGPTFCSSDYKKTELRPKLVVEFYK